MNESSASKRNVIRIDGKDAIDPSTQEGPRSATKLMSVRDVRRMADTYHALMQCDALGHCRSIPLELVLAVLSSDDMLVPQATVLASVDAPENITRRWLDILLNKKVFMLLSNDKTSYLSLTPAYAAQFEFEI